jgi:hypothetical protein
VPSSTAAVTKAALSSVAFWQCFGGYEASNLDRHDDELRDAIATVNLIGLRGVSVDEHNANLASITRIDQTWRI